MLIGITGTPGTGKTTVASELRRRGNDVLDLKTTVAAFVVGNEDGADIIDTDAWSNHLAEIEGYAEGILAHYLPCDKLIVLRCRPDVLKIRLSPRGYPEHKVRENAEAEALDVILIEAVEMVSSEKIFEIDTTNKDINEIVDMIEAFVGSNLPAAFGSLDWSEYGVNI